MGKSVENIVEEKCMFNENSNQIAYLIQAYADNNAFKQLVHVLLDMNNCHIFVHLDAKSNMDDFFIKDERVHFIEQREFVSWAGYAQGKLIFNLIEAALKFPLKFQYYSFLSESDYPVYTGKQLVDKMVVAKSVLLNCTKEQKNKIERYWFYDFNVKSPKINKVISKLVNLLFGLLYKMRICKKDNQVTIDGKKVDVYCSGPFWCYNFKQLEYINNVYKRNSEFQKYFKHSFASCELMVSTIIGNSQYKDECEFVEKYINLNQLSSMCFFKYTGPRVDVLTIEDYDDIIASGKPFIRKVNANKSAELLVKLKEA